VVEFGIVALLFTALMFAIVDFGLLLNTWLAVSSGTRDIARTASVGKGFAFLQDQAMHLNMPAVSTTGFTGGRCCGPTSAIEVQVEYVPSGCAPISTCAGAAQSSVSADYPFHNLDPTPPPGPSQNHGNAPAMASGLCTVASGCHPQADDMVRVTVIAHGAQVITPLIRMAFDNCRDGTNPECHVPLQSQVTMRYEGQEF
jgi:hypothetical protein